MRLRAFTASPLASTTAPAPSLMPEALPAVTVPSFLKAGRILLSDSTVVDAFTSSSVTNTMSPFLQAVTTGTIWLLKWPAAMAAEARRCDEIEATSQTQGIALNSSWQYKEPPPKEPKVPKETKAPKTPKAVDPNSGPEVRKRLAEAGSGISKRIEEKEQKIRELTARATDPAMTERVRQLRFDSQGNTITGWQDTPEYKLIRNERDRAWRQVSGLQAEVAQLQHSQARELRKSIYADRPAEFTFHRKVGVKGITKAMDKAVAEGAEEFGKIVGKGHDIEGRYVFYGKAESGRAHYGMNGAIYLGKDSGTRVVVHELGHWLEDFDEGVHKRAVAFLERRTAGEPVKSLADIFPGASYDSYEMTKVDKFIHPYMGKIYSGGRATEIISMGLEQLYSDPLGFARTDPDYFDFIWNLLRGRK